MKRLEEYDTLPIPVSDIYYDDEFNCRGEFTLQSLTELAESIKAGGGYPSGLLVPGIVQPACDVPKKINKPYRMVAGHRRFKSVTVLLKWEFFPCQIRQGLNPHQALLLNLEENIKRNDLTPWEEALALVRMYPDGIASEQGVGIFRTKGTPATEVARQLKCSQRWVLDRLKILKLPPEVQQMLHAGRIHIYDVPVILRHIRERHLAVANEIAASKNGRKLQDRKPEMRRRFRRRRSKKEINDMTGVMLDAGVNPLAPRVASWCAGFITDEELMSDFATNKDAEAYSNKNESQ